MSMKIVGAHVVFHRMVNTPFDKDGKQRSMPAVLLYKRTQDAPIHPSYWALIGGCPERQENPKSALCREAREELKAGGLEQALECLKNLCRVDMLTEQGKVSIEYFTVPLNEDMDTLKLLRNPNGKVEGEGLAWFTEEEVHHLHMRPEDRQALNTFFKNE